MGFFVRRPRLLRRPRLIPRSVRIGPVRVSRRRTTLSAGPIGYSEPRKRH